MKQDVSIITHQKENAADVLELLLHHRIKVQHFNNIHDAKVGLALHSPTFLLLDFTIAGAIPFFDELLKRISEPRPYIIISARFLSGKDRAVMLRKGADACVDNPMVSEEILAVIEAVLRREQQNAQQQGESLSCVEYKDLRIDPLHRTVTMRDEFIVLTAKEFDVLYFLASHIDKGFEKMDIGSKAYVVALLESYQKRSKQIELLHYELDHPARVTADEMIGALALAQGDSNGGGRPGGHASDKTLYIALNYQARTDRINSDSAEEVVGQLVTLEREQERLNYYVSLLKTRHADLLRLLYFEGYSQEECAKKLEVAARTVRRIKDEAIDELTEMYSFTGGLANKGCPQTVQQISE